jgi:hypothetical protein
MVMDVNARVSVLLRNHKLVLAGIGGCHLPT